MFGPPFIHRMPDLGWGPFQQHIPGKTKEQPRMRPEVAAGALLGRVGQLGVRGWMWGGWGGWNPAGEVGQGELAAYLLVFLEHLQDAAQDPSSTHGSEDCLPHALLFAGAKGELATDKILERLAALHLLALKMWQHGNRPPAAFYCGPPRDLTLYHSLSGRKGGWGAAQDLALVKGVFLVGYDSWVKLLKVPSLHLVAPLRNELGLALDYDTPHAALKAVGPTAPGSAEHTQLASDHKKRVGLKSTKERAWLDKRVRAIVNALRLEFGPAARSAVGGPPGQQLHPPGQQQVEGQGQGQAQVQVQVSRGRQIVRRGRGRPPLSAGSMLPGQRGAAGQGGGPPGAAAPWQHELYHMCAGLKAQFQSITSETNDEYYAKLEPLVKALHEEVPDAKYDAKTLAYNLVQILHFQEAALGKDAMPPRPAPKLPIKLLTDPAVGGALHAIALKLHDIRRTRSLKAIEWQNPGKRKEVYKRLRNVILDLHLEGLRAGRQQLSFHDVTQHLGGEVNSLRSGPSAEQLAARRPLLVPVGGQPSSQMPPGDAALFDFQRPSRLEASAATQQGGYFSAMPSTAAAARGDLRGGVQGALSIPACGGKGSDIGLNPSVLCPVYCSAMPWVDCTMLRYHCTRYPDVNLCPAAFAEGRFPAGCSSRDFVRLDGTQRQPSSDDWRPEETMLLLEGLELYKEDWAAIAAHVGTRSQAACLMHFVRLPIEDQFIDDVAGMGSTTAAAATATASSAAAAAAAAAQGPAGDGPTTAAAALARHGLLGVGPDGLPLMPFVEDQNPLMSLPISQQLTLAAAAAGLAAAAVRAKQLAEAEEREIQRLMVTLVDIQTKKVNYKEKLLLELGGQYFWMELNRPIAVLVDTPLYATAAAAAARCWIVSVKLLKRL
eukprot:gene5697-5935_t